MYFKSLLAAMTAAVCIASADGKVTLPSLMSSDMVLQRNTEVNIWGKAKPGVKVSVTPSWSGKKYTTKADAEGRWITKIATADAGGPYTLTISDGEPVELKDVMLGESVDLQRSVKYGDAGTRIYASGYPWFCGRHYRRRPVF